MGEGMKTKGVAVAQEAEHRIVAPEVADSSSVGHSFDLDLQERIAIRMDAGQSKEEATKKAKAEMKRWRKK